MVAARWSIRCIGLISTFILARLLVPADFGVVAMAMVTIGLIEVFGETGLLLYIIRHPDPQPSDLDTVWTLRLIIGLTLSAVIFLAAPLGASFCHELRVEDAMRLLALRPLLAGAENPGVVMFRRKMNFAKDFEYLVVNKVVSFLVTVTLAVILRTYWALIVGILVGGTTSAFQSYRMHPFRPRFGLRRAGVAWHFSSWLLVNHLLLFLGTRVDEIIIGRLKSTAAMGTYSIASDVASSPIQEIMTPLGRVLFPGLSHLASEPEKLAAAFNKVMSAVAVAAFAVAIGIALVADDFITLALGARWRETVPPVRVLAIASGTLMLSQPCSGPAHGDQPCSSSCDLRPLASAPVGNRHGACGALV